MSAAAASSSRKVNLRSTAVKRIMQEAAELADPEEDDFVAAPLEVGQRSYGPSEPLATFDHGR